MKGLFSLAADLLSAYLGDVHYLVEDRQLQNQIGRQLISRLSVFCQIANDLFD